MNSTKEHWEKVFSRKLEVELSWFQPYPKTSMEFIDLFCLSPDSYTIDIRGGDSHFVDALLDRGYQHIYVLDISATALERAKKRLGERSSRVNWIVSDIIDFVPPVQFDFWHDRQLFIS